MPKQLIKRYMPDHQKVREHKHLRFFGSLLHSANLWHLNRRSVTGAFAVGLFITWIPIPFQMVLATAVAILLGVNVLISVGLVWVTNPVTMPLLFWFAYWSGSNILGVPPTNVEFELSFGWLGTTLQSIWKPFLLGCFLNGTVSAILGYYGMRYFWIWHVAHQWRKRHAVHT